MIHIDRTPGDDACEALAKAGAKGLSETEHALWFYANIEPDLVPLPPKPTKAPNFGAYKKQPVKDALRALFGVKCAYCESDMAHVGPMEVEHYRPKGGYLNDMGVLTKPGYFWLAASWENLLPSCVDCNRERKQYHRAGDGKLVKTKSGKANHFPVVAGTPRATCEAEVEDEQPLLLDPCNDNDQPQDHLVFLANGFVMPATSEAEALKPKGLETIRVFGLVREHLVNHRKGTAGTLTAFMVSIMDADRNVREHPTDPALVTQRAQREADLQAHLTDRSPFLAMAKSMAETFTKVRDLCDRYHRARRVWEDSKDVDDEEAVAEVVREIDALRRGPTVDKAFVNFLFRSADALVSGPST